MYTVLLADDEQQILDNLKESISWQDFGVDTVLCAADGQEALDLTDEHIVDLLIADIRMPRLDGIELIRQVRIHHPATHCVLLTAYGEFEYAREALLLGVENYLLKPIQIEEVESTIYKALENIYSQQNNTEFLFRNNILIRWLTGNISNEELSERANCLNINVYLPTYCVICLQKKRIGGSLAIYRTKCVEILEKNFDVYHFWDNKGRYIYIIGGNHPDRESLAGQFRKLADDLMVNPAVILAIGTVVTGSEELFQSYKAAEEAIACADYSSEDIVLLIAGQQDIQMKIFRETVLALLQVESKDANPDEGHNDAYQFVSQIKSAEQANDMISFAAQLICDHLKQQFPKYSGNQEAILSCVRHFTVIPAPKDLNSALNDLILAGRAVRQAILKEFSPVILLALHYIHTNYNRSLSIKEFCIKNGMNPSYLGFLFKEETGLFFNDYVAQYRIGRSIQLLRNPEIKINEIAEQVGFCSPSYFIQCFRKQTGLSPVKYRTIHSQERDPR